MDGDTKFDTLEREKHALEFAKFLFEKEKWSSQESNDRVNLIRARNETIDRLLNVIQYLNRLQDDLVIVQESITPVTQTEKGRVWNAHEEDIANAALIALKQVIVGVAEQQYR
jgi:hypothetical protein